MNQLELKIMMELQAKLEAILFQYGEPMPVKKIIGLLGVERNDFQALLSEWTEALENNPARGLALMQKEDRIQLVTKPDFHSLTQKMIQEEFREELTPTAVETLAVVAYLGPLPKSTIDYVRGVNSSFTLRNLLVRGLVERKAEAEKSNVYHYQVTFDFLRHMGLGRVEELPEYEKYVNLLKEFELGVY